MAGSRQAPLVRPSIGELCDRYDNENVHTGHVARLALDLFDRLARRMGFGAADRRLLKTAARLHDVGYRLAPARHPQVGAALVIRHGLRGFRPSEVRRVAAILRLHAGDGPTALADPLVSRLTDRARIMRLGALLRAADGLDHGHVQDAVIRRVIIGKRSIRVAVASPWFPYNVVRANAKADLWNGQCPVPLQFVLVPTRSQDRHPLTNPAVALTENARRWLSLEFKRIQINVAGAIDGTDPEPLHQLRVALRRLRLLLRSLGKHLPSTEARRLERELGIFSEALSRGRDDDVWLAFLAADGVPAAVRDNPRWEPFWEEQQRARAEHQAATARSLRCRQWTSLRQRVARFLRVTLPRAAAAAGKKEPTLQEVTRQRFAKAVRRVHERARLRHAASPRKLHRLRIALRRGRHLGSLFADQLSPQQRQLARRLKRLDQALGQVHDIDNDLARCAEAVPPPPRELVRLLRRHRKARLAWVRGHWKSIEV